jgi:hypothetical protein
MEGIPRTPDTPPSVLKAPVAQAGAFHLLSAHATCAPINRQLTIKNQAFRQGAIYAGFFGEVHFILG